MGKDRAGSTPALPARARPVRAPSHRRRLNRFPTAPENAARVPAPAVGTRLPGCRHPCEYGGMTDGPTPHELSERTARLEERMKTMQAEYKTDIALLAKTIAEDNAKRDTEAAKRDKDNLRWQVGLWIAAIVVLGFIIRFSAD